MLGSSETERGSSRGQEEGKEKMDIENMGMMSA